MAEWLPSPGEVIKALTEEVVLRILDGEKPAAIRAELLADGLAPELVNPILAHCAPLAITHSRSTVAAVVSAVIVIVCSAAGLAAGMWWTTLLDEKAWLINIFAIPFCVLSCLAAGAAVGLGITALLARWSESESEPDDGSEQTGCWEACE